MGSRIALITGASFGLGFGLVKAFLEEGYEVIAVSRTLGDLGELLQTVNSSKVRLQYIKSDLMQQEECERLVSSLAEKEEINVVIHNVGGARQRGTLHSLSARDWIETIQLNLMSSVTLTKGLWKKLATSRSPRILFISSLVALEPGDFDPHYSSAKAGLLNFAKHVARLGASENILSNCLLPGPIVTKSLVNFIDEQNTLRESVDAKTLEEVLISKIPLKRLGHPSDIAGMALFLCSPENEWITGASIKIDGGKSYSIS